MSKVRFSRCPKLIPVQKNSTVGDEKDGNQQSRNSENTFDILENQEAPNNTAVVNSSISIDSEKMLPFNKRKSQYYVWQEGESALPTPEEFTGPGDEIERRPVKIRSLRSIYRRTKPIIDA